MFDKEDLLLIIDINRLTVNDIGFHSTILQLRWQSGVQKISPLSINILGVNATLGEEPQQEIEEDGNTQALELA